MGVRSIVAGAAAVLSTACSAAPPVSLNGTWTGEWRSTQPNASVAGGTVSMTITQNGPDLTGSGNVSPYGSGKLTGSYSAATGNVTGKLQSLLGSVTFDGKAAGDSISGTYISSLADSGSFSVSRKTGGGYPFPQ